MLPDTLSRENRDRWTAGKATWNAFAGIPWQVVGKKGYLERFRGDTVAGGRRERLPGTLLRENRARWAARGATWHAFAGIPWQVGGGKGYLEHFRGNTVAGGRREETPGTLSQGFRARWSAGRCHLEHFRGDTVAGGRRERLPGTLLREYSATLPGGKFYWDMKLNLY